MLSVGKEEDENFWNGEKIPFFIKFRPQRVVEVWIFWYLVVARKLKIFLGIFCFLENRCKKIWSIGSFPFSVLSTSINEIISWIKYSWEKIWISVLFCRRIWVRRKQLGTSSRLSTQLNSLEFRYKNIFFSQFIRFSTISKLFCCLNTWDVVNSSCFYDCLKPKRFETHKNYYSICIFFKIGRCETNGKYIFLIKFKFRLLLVPCKSWLRVLERRKEICFQLGSDLSVVCSKIQKFTCEMRKNINQNMRVKWCCW